MTEARALRDREARRIIEERLHVNLLVEAGAGSGKTECLARRMAAGIAAGRYHVEEMAAVTFTRKAAAELRGRFQLELEQRLREDPDPGRRERIQRALGNLERLFAGTIHAFCAHLIRERPVEAGVAPGFTEQDELEDAAFRARSWRDFLDRERARDSPVLRDLREAGIRPTDLDDAFATMCAFSDVAFPPGDAVAPDPAPAWDALDRFWKRLEPLLPAISQDTDCPVQKAARRCRGRLRVADRARPATLAELLALWEKRPRVKPSYWGGPPRELRATRAAVDRLIDDFHAGMVAPFLAAWRAHCYGLAVSLLAAGRDFAAEARRRALALNYGDLLEVAARLLRDNPSVRCALQDKYRWLFVDEFQDTNPLQAEVVLLLAAEASGESDWTRLSLRPGALFAVGDPKQSIYRFSGADIEIYTRTREIIARSRGEVVPLTTSFRAIPALCEWANKVFRSPRFFAETATPEQPAFHPLEPCREPGDTQRTGLRTLMIPASVGSSGVASADAEAIARLIRRNVDEGRRGYGDFLILTRKKAQLSVYAAALDALHIPVSVSGAVAFSRSREVTILAGLLRALADPDDGVALVGVLRGALFGLSDEDLFRHREAGFAFILTAGVPEDAPGLVAEAIRALQAMYRLTRTLPAGAAVERIVEMSGLLARATTATPGGAEAGDLLHALSRVRQTTEAGGSLAAAAAILEQDLDGSEVESIPLEPGRQDVVRVMNLHKAKGLEAPVVFLADPLGGVRPRASIRIIRDGSRAIGYFEVVRSWGDYGRDVLARPADWDAHAAAELGYVAAEEARLLYVAATRARDLLVVSAWAGSGTRQARPWEPFAGFLAGAPALPILPAPGRAPAVLPDLSAEARNRAAGLRGASREEGRRPSSGVESVTATSHHAGPPGRPLQPGETREPDTGMAWGSLIHFLLEHAMRGGSDRTHLVRLANWFAFDRPELRAVIPGAILTVERVMASDFWRRAMAAEERQVEVPFAVRLAVPGGPPQILHGVVDLAFKTAEGWTLIDYKTDQATVPDLVKQYGDQIRAYATQWAGLTGGRVAYAGLYAVRSGELSQPLC